MRTFGISNQTQLIEQYIVACNSSERGVVSTNPCPNPSGYAAPRISLQCQNAPEFPHLVFARYVTTSSVITSRIHIFDCCSFLAGVFGEALAFVVYGFVCLLSCASVCCWFLGRREEGDQLQSGVRMRRHRAPAKFSGFPAVPLEGE